jgi:hypothetical protein
MPVCIARTVIHQLNHLLKTYFKCIFGPLFLFISLLQHTNTDIESIKHNSTAMYLHVFSPLNLIPWRDSNPGLLILILFLNLLYNGNFCEFPTFTNKPPKFPTLSSSHQRQRKLQSSTEYYYRGLFK